MAKRFAGSLRFRRMGLDYLTAFLLGASAAIVLLGVWQGKEAAPPEPLEIRRMEETTAPTEEDETGLSDETAAAASWVLNTKSLKFHRPDCQSVQDIKPQNRMDYTGPRDNVVAAGYVPCQRCNP
ncbi:MAG: hypothetical protein IKS52_05960 [Clostridia bacterium]|nr:hypothetical protein [Clostridia bacterium]